PAASSARTCGSSDICPDPDGCPGTVTRCRLRICALAWSADALCAAGVTRARHRAAGPAVRLMEGGDVGVLDRFERGIDRVVNGAFARAFRSQVEPVELASALRREADNRAAVVSRGRTLTANAYAVELSSADHERLGPISSELRQDLRQVVGDHAIEQGYSFVGPVSVTFEVADDLDTGMSRVRATIRRHEGYKDDPFASIGGSFLVTRYTLIVPATFYRIYNN